MYSQWLWLLWWGSPLLRLQQPRVLTLTMTATVDLNEAKKAASELFDKLDTDKDGTLDSKELNGRLTHKESSRRPIQTTTAR
jgi:hypothetical protein